MRGKKLLSFRTVLTLFLVALLVFPALTVKADTTTNEAVTADTNGVIQVKVVYTDDERNNYLIQTGTGFLINDETVVTCNHVVSLDPDLLAAVAEHYGKSEKEIKDRLSIQISVVRDVVIRANVKTSSEEMDFAVLQMETSIKNRTYLTIRSSSEVKQTEAIYALGFPSEVEMYQDMNSYTSEDVTITNGQVNKNTTVGTVDYIQHSARLTPGNSGGPLVDAEGSVIGICQGATSGNGFDVDYYYAIAIDQLISALDALGIDYTKTGNGGGNVVVQPSDKPGDEEKSEPVSEISVPTSEIEQPGPVNTSELSATIRSAGSKNETDYTAESWANFKNAFDDANTVMNNPAATQDQVNAANQKLADAITDLAPAPAFKFPVWAIIAIVIVLLIIIIVVVLIIVLTSGKKNKKPATGNTYVGGTTGYNPAGMNSAAPTAGPSGFAAPPVSPATNFSTMPSGVGAGETSVLNAGAGETTVLNAGAGETTLLNSNVNYGTLTRSKTGEKIKINCDNFVIGKELSRVNYCVSDNTSISRTHVRFTNKGGITYVTDLKTTNGTFLNSVKLQPNQETALNNGDKLSLSDEEFVFSN